MRDERRAQTLGPAGLWRKTLGGAICAVLLLSLAGSALGGGAGAPKLPARPTGVAADALDARLAAVAEGLAEGGTAAALRSAREQRLRVTAGRTVVVAQPAPAVGRAAAERAIRQRGGRITGRGGGLLEAHVPLQGLRQLAGDPRLASVRAPALFVPDAVSEGVAFTRATLWHAAGLAGAGVKVAVLDPGFQGYAALLGTELPASVETHNLCAPGPVTGVTAHGTAVAEVVHDMAPAAQLRLVCFDSELDLQPAVDAAVAAGVSVIVHAVSWLNTSRGDGNGGPGTPEAAARSARQQGILWINSAGNWAQRYWGGPFRDADGDEFHDFGPANYNVAWFEDGETACLALRWDAWPVTDQDFDLYLVDVDAYGEMEIVAASTTDQAGSPGPPVESLCYHHTGPRKTYVIFVHRYSASTAPRLDLFLAGSSALNFSVPEGSVAEPASSPAVLAVGAVCRPWGTLEPFSSRGPTIDGRPKPELTAPHGVSTATAGPSTSCADGFRGTSAAAPHVAGLAALAKGRTPSMPAAELASYLEALARTESAERAVAFHPVVEGNPLAYDMGPSRQPRLGTIDGSVPPVVSPAGATPRVSPDGSRVAFLGNAGTSGAELHVANRDGTGLLQLTTGGGARAAWAPDGQALYFVRAGEIHRVGIDGTGEVQLTAGAMVGSRLDVSPDGTSIVYVAWVPSGGGHVFRIHRRNVDGGGLVDLTPPAWEGQIHDPRYSPDGSRIAFTRQHLGDSKIWVMNADGSGSRALAHPHFDSIVAWVSNDEIVFGTDRHSGSIYRRHVDTGALVRLTHALFERRFSDVAPAPVAPTVVDQATVAGTLAAGSYLAASPAVWTGTLPLRIARQWHRCDPEGLVCTPIPGATDLFYRVTPSDLAGSLRFTETASNSGGTASAYVGRPASLAPPILVGSVGTLVLLDAVRDVWAGSPTEVLYRWQRQVEGERSPQWVDIPYARFASYWTGLNDLGARIRVLAAARNRFGTSPWAASAPTSQLGSYPLAARHPRLDTSMQPFRVVPGDWRGHPGPTLSWQWTRFAGPGDPGPIPGATGPTYQPTAADVGFYLQVVETATNVHGSQAFSLVTGGPVSIVSVAPPQVSGDATVGGLLTATGGSWQPSGLALTYRWQRSSDLPRWEDVAGASGPTYTVKAADARYRLRVVVTASAGSQPQAAPSAPTARVAP